MRFYNVNYNRGIEANDAPHRLVIGTSVGSALRPRQALSVKGYASRMCWADGSSPGLPCCRRDGRS